LKNRLIIAAPVMIAALAAAGAQGQQSSLPFFHPHDHIVFQGDSITDGGRWRSGQDYNHIMGQDYAYILAAEAGAEFPERDLTFVNRGIGGEGIPGLTARWTQDAIELKPNLLSILVGVNDTFSPGPAGESAEQFEQGYDRLLQQTLQALPGVKIILGEPFVLPVGKYSDNYEAKRAQLKPRQDAVEKLARKYHLALVKYQDAFDEACRRAPAEHWSWDGIHPTYAGHWLMKQAWLAAASAHWPQG
jgi:lysophospholipase L1-like esterase